MTRLIAGVGTGAAEGLGNEARLQVDAAAPLGRRRYAPGMGIVRNGFHRRVAARLREKGARPEIRVIVNAPRQSGSGFGTTKVKTYPRAGWGN